MTITKEKIREYLEQDIKNFGIDTRIKRINYLTKTEAKEFIINQAVDNLYNLMNAIDKGYEVYSEKLTDTNNRSTYNIWYLSIENNIPKRNKFFSILLMEYVNNQYCFSSCVYGMPRRILDATDYVFSLIRSLGGKYIQID